MVLILTLKVLTQLVLLLLIVVLQLLHVRPQTVSFFSGVAQLKFQGFDGPLNFQLLLCLIKVRYDLFSALLVSSVSITFFGIVKVLVHLEKLDISFS